MLWDTSWWKSRSCSTRATTKEIFWAAGGTVSFLFTWRRTAHGCYGRSLCHGPSRRIQSSPFFLLSITIFPHNYSSLSTWLPVVSLETAGWRAWTVTGSESVLRGDRAVFLLIPATTLTVVQWTSGKHRVRQNNQAHCWLWKIWEMRSGTKLTALRNFEQRS